MAFGSWRYFKTRNMAIAYGKKLQKKGYYVSEPEQMSDKRWGISILNKRGHNVFYIRGY